MHPTLTTEIESQDQGVISGDNYLSAVNPSIPQNFVLTPCNIIGLSDGMAKKYGFSVTNKPSQEGMGTSSSILTSPPVSLEMQPLQRSEIQPGGASGPSRV